MYLDTMKLDNDVWVSRLKSLDAVDEKEAVLDLNDLVYQKTLLFGL